MIRVGVDVGGTFTDFVVYDTESGTYDVFKTSSTPGDPSEAILGEVDAIGLAGRRIEMFAHGTTVTTNAIIQKRTAKVGLITTAGFTDLLHFRRTNRGDLYDVQWDPPEPLVPRPLRRGVAERVDYSGKIVVDLDLEQVRQAADFLVGQGCEALAIAFLNSYVNPSHEQAAKELILGEHPSLYVTASADLLPEWREFERTSTTVINSATGPLLERYLQRLRLGLSERQYQGELFVMLSNGGLSTSRVASEVAAQTLESGPAAGVIAQRALAASVGIRNVVGLDMGGTSTDVSLVLDGQQQVTPYQEVEFGAVVTLPSVDIKSIGAGGGSIAWVDKGGGLNVGPQSAAAQPGPACYGRGGQEPTVTDANVVLGRLGESSLLGGKLRIDSALAMQAITTRIAEPLQLSAVDAAAGVIRLAVHNMVNAVRLMTVERGLDPRDFVLLAYGGAGPMHAVGIAAELGIERVLIPPHPGNTSALGLLMADVRHDFVQTVLQDSSHINNDLLESVFAGMEQKARERLRAEGVPPDQMDISRAADLRYWGQTHDLTVPVPSRTFDASVLAEVRSAFDAGHQREFWHSEPADHPVELVNLRVSGYGRLNKYQVGERRQARVAKTMGAPRRAVYFEGLGFVETAIYEKDALATDSAVRGPAIVEQLDSTTVVYPNRTFVVDRYDNIQIHLQS